MFKKFAYVEDYVEIIDGTLNPLTGKRYNIFDTTAPVIVINLARYDISVISNMASAAASGQSYTDRQAELAIKLILKYKRQLTAFGIDISSVEDSPKFRTKLRVIDRRKLLFLQDNRICLQFPYDTTLIEDIRDIAKISHGGWVFHKENKIWYLAITEPNVIAVGGFAKIHQFEISSEFSELEQSVLSVEVIPYDIKLYQTPNGYAISNAHQTLDQYVNDHVGGFDKNNVHKLIDAAGILGYDVDADIQQQVIDEYSARLCDLMMNRITKFEPNPDDTIYTDIIQYAVLTDRWPIYVYEPDRSDKMLNNFVKKYFTNDEILHINDLRTALPDFNGKRIIYMNKYTAKEHSAIDIPLLLSSAGMMHGGDKTMLLQRSKKVIYFTTSVYTTHNDGRK